MILIELLSCTIPVKWPESSHFGHLSGMGLPFACLWLDLLPECVLMLLCRVCLPWWLPLSAFLCLVFISITGSCVDHSSLFHAAVECKCLSLSRLRVHSSVLGISFTSGRQRCFGCVRVGRVSIIPVSSMLQWNANVCLWVSYVYVFLCNWSSWSLRLQVNYRQGTNTDIYRDFQNPCNTVFDLITQ